MNPNEIEKLKSLQNYLNARSDKCNERAKRLKAKKIRESRGYYNGLSAGLAISASLLASLLIALSDDQALALETLDPAQVQPWP